MRVLPPTLRCLRCTVGTQSVTHGRATLQVRGCFKLSVVTRSRVNLRMFCDIARKGGRGQHGAACFMSRHHSSGRCRQCEHRSTTSTARAMHERLHTGERPVACSYCEYRSRQKSTLVEHEERHVRRGEAKRTHSDSESLGGYDLEATCVIGTVAESPATDQRTTTQASTTGPDPATGSDPGIGSFPAQRGTVVDSVPVHRDERNLQVHLRYARPGPAGAPKASSQPRTGRESKSTDSESDAQSHWQQLQVGASATSPGRSPGRKRRSIG